MRSVTPSCRAPSSAAFTALMRSATNVGSDRSALPERIPAAPLHRQQPQPSLGVLGEVQSRVDELVDLGLVRAGQQTQPQRTAIVRAAASRIRARSSAGKRRPVGRLDRPAVCVDRSRARRGRTRDPGPGRSGRAHAPRPRSRAAAPPRGARSPCRARSAGGRSSLRAAGSERALARTRSRSAASGQAVPSASCSIASRKCSPISPASSAFGSSAIPSSHAPTDACERARCVVVIVPYAASRRRACLKLSSTSPDRLDVGRVNTRPRSARRRNESPMSAAPRAARTGPSQKTRPTTAASWRTRRSASGSASIRATSTAWIESGIAALPASDRWRTASSRKYGLPSARATTVRAHLRGQRARREQRIHQAGGIVDAQRRDLDADQIVVRQEGRLPTQERRSGGPDEQDRTVEHRGDRR